MAHVTFSDVVSKGQVDVDGGYIAERQRGHTHEMDAHHCFQLVLVSADSRTVGARQSVSRPFVRCSEQCGQQTLRKSSSVANT